MIQKAFKGIFSDFNWRMAQNRLQKVENVKTFVNIFRETLFEIGIFRSNKSSEKLQIKVRSTFVFGAFTNKRARLLHSLVLFKTDSKRRTLKLTFNY